MRMILLSYYKEGEGARRPYTRSGHPSSVVRKHGPLGGKSIDTMCPRCVYIGVTAKKALQFFGERVAGRRVEAPVGIHSERSVCSNVAAPKKILPIRIG